MKKIILFSMLLLSFFSSAIAKETTLYTGPKNMPSDWSGNVQFQASTFSDAKAGEIIRVYISDVASGAQGSFKTMDSNWSAIASGTDYFSINGNYYELEITSDILTALQSTGLVVSGHDYTVNSVTLIDNSDVQTTETTLYDTQTVIGSWNSVQLAPSSFNNAKINDVIIVYISGLGNNAQGSFKTASSGWPAIADGYDYFSISGSSYKLIITDAILSQLKATGLIISGQNYTIDKVTLISTSLTPVETVTTTDKMFPMTSDNSLTVLNNADFRASTQKLTLSAYGVAGWEWDTPYDFSQYSKLTVILGAAADQNITVAIGYTRSASAGIGKIAAGADSVTVALDNTYSNSVDNVLLYTTDDGVASSLTLSKVYVTTKTSGEIAAGIQDIASAETTAVPVATSYYNVNGQKLSTLQRGLVIVRTKMSDSTFKTKKIIIK